MLRKLILAVFVISLVLAFSGSAFSGEQYAAPEKINKVREVEPVDEQSLPFECIELDST